MNRDGCEFQLLQPQMLKMQATRRNILSTLWDGSVMKQIFFDSDNIQIQKILELNIQMKPEVFFLEWWTKMLKIVTEFCFCIWPQQWGY